MKPAAAIAGVRARAERDADGGCGERWHVVDAVAHHRHIATRWPATRSLHHARLVGGAHLGADVVAMTTAEAMAAAPSR